jgi:hypothetical protein
MLWPSSLTLLLTQTEASDWSMSGTHLSYSYSLF